MGLHLHYRSRRSFLWRNLNSPPLYYVPILVHISHLLARELATARDKCSLPRIPPPKFPRVPRFACREIGIMSTPYYAEYYEIGTMFTEYYPKIERKYYEFLGRELGRHSFGNNLLLPGWSDSGAVNSGNPQIRQTFSTPLVEGRGDPLTTARSRLVHLDFVGSAIWMLPVGAIREVSGGP